MITYFYWALVFGLSMLAMLLLGRSSFWKAGFVVSMLVLLAGGLAYYFHFEQIFVKRYGGVMSISVPEGQVHLGATWKDENLWIENFEPATNICHFSEYSKGNLLQGKVLIKNCNPVLPSELPSH
jgi:hypothetical protein